MSDDNVTPIINRMTVGLDQLEQFDSDGVAGPGVTSAMAFAKVREQAVEIKSLALRLHSCELEQAHQRTCASEWFKRFQELCDAAGIPNASGLEHQQAVEAIRSQGCRLNKIHEVLTKHHDPMPAEVGLGVVIANLEQVIELSRPVVETGTLIGKTSPLTKMEPHDFEPPSE